MAEQAGTVGREALVDVAMGYEPADAVVVNGRLLNVHTGTFTSDSIGIKNGRIACLGKLDYAVGPQTKVIDAGGRYVTPGFLDPHLHQWHSYHNGTAFASALVEHGTTAVADGIYGPSIIAGVRAIRFFLDEIKATPLKLLFLVPTASYTLNRYIGFPPAPNTITAQEMLGMLDWPESVGVEETGYDLLLNRERRDPAILALFDKALSQRKVITGHGPNIPGDRAISGWVAAGVMNNHEIISQEEAVRQAELGLYVLVREGCSCRDVNAVVRAITESRLDSRAFQLCTDVATAEYVAETGQVDHAVREAIKRGLDPVRAFQMATIQPAEFFRVNHDLGVIAPGRYADLLLLDDLASVQVERVIATGDVYVERGQWVRELQQPTYPRWLYETMNIARRPTPADFRVAAPFAEGRIKVRVIGVTDGLLVTDERVLELRVANGEILADPTRGINKVSLIDRVFGNGEIGVAFVQGFELAGGAIGSSANVFNQDIVVVGATDGDIAAVANAIVDRSGAFVAVRDGEVIADFPTPLLGLCCDLPYKEAVGRASRLVAAFRDLGCRLEAPMVNLEFITVVGIPSLRISTKGLTFMHEDSYKLLPLIVD